MKKTIITLASRSGGFATVGAASAKPCLHGFCRVAKEEEHCSIRLR